MSYLSYVSQKGDTAWDTYISQGRPRPSLAECYILEGT